MRRPDRRLHVRGVARRAPRGPSKAKKRSLPETVRRSDLGGRAPYRRLAAHAHAPGAVPPGGALSARRCRPDLWLDLDPVRCSGLAFCRRLGLGAALAFEAGRVVRAGLPRGVADGDAVHGLVRAGLQGVQAGRPAAGLVLRRGRCCVRRRRFRGEGSRIRGRFPKVPVALQSRDDPSSLSVRGLGLCGALGRPALARSYGVVIRIMLSTWEPPIGIEPVTYALRVACCLPAHALPAPIARIIALTAPMTLGLSGTPFHEPFHGRGAADSGRRP